MFYIWWIGVKMDTHKGCYILKSCTDEFTDDFIDKVKRVVENHSSAEPVLLSTTSTLCARGKSLSAFFINLYRKYTLHRNERVTVLSQDDQMVALQLVLAERQKQAIGDFDVEASRVIEMNRRIRKLKLGGLNPDRCEDSPETLGRYEDFLRNGNYCDVMDIFVSISTEMEQNESLKLELCNQSLLLIVNQDDPCTLEELKMIELLCKSRQTVKVEVSRAVMSAEGSSPDISLNVSSCQSVLEWINHPSNKCNATCTSPTKSATESFIHVTLMSYLELLVNSRSELSLARVINIPNRGLDHSAFTDLKKYAQMKNMPMYQTAISFITRIRLGGKGYAPNSSCPLSQHVKGIGEFSDLMQKLQTVVEEDVDTRSACRRIVNMLKNAFLRDKENRLRKSSIESSAEQIQTIITELISSLDLSNSDSPDRPAGCGGTLVGRQTVKVIRMLLDQEATRPISRNTSSIFGDLFSSQKTPVHLPCLLTKFRSPEEDLSKEHNQSLAERMKAKVKKRIKVKSTHYKSEMDWAVPLCDLPEGEMQDMCTRNGVIVIPSKTLVQPAEGKDIGLSLAKPILGPRSDKENIPDNSNQGILNQKLKTRRDALCSKTSERRTCPDEDTSLEPASKKMKLQPLKAKKNVRRKLIPQIKGQSSLMKFFRV